MYTVQSAGGVILNPEKGILLVYNRDTQTWTFPKGHVEEGESFLEACEREIEEEAGLTDLELIKELPVFVRGSMEDSQKQKRMHLFLFKTSIEDSRSNTEGITEIRWFPIDEVSSKFSYDEEKEFFESIKPLLRNLCS